METQFVVLNGKLLRRKIKGLANQVVVRVHRRAKGWEWRAAKRVDKRLKKGELLQLGPIYGYFF
ncbi:hypothetical protein GCM10023186_27710 [Hymenobacter koreensis]|uniref:Uncharacterized protein n=1 Tax=Hymenobacter koreensis TaxID=1084523 RepID=A0ABP8J4H6_9BACT